ncbi:CbtA family protein [Rhizobium sp. KVB221]|uniref:CbtA family protein n=1 Tax=Rhizobium setariae TaxID=2801340 RepID=A0A936YPA2_9HYPH|nr:CbtA family protein [Rhizobium setariae]MBL0373158.1 CbtA family protein [Rhizobium setariae]
MVVKYLLAALVAGLISGGLVTVAQQARVVPLILEAEKYENAPAEVHEHTSGLNISFATKAMAHETSAEAGAEDEGGMLFGVNRLTGTIMANVVTGCGFALILLAASLFTGTAVTVANGALWGAAAWLAFQLLPSVGLPPELPGFPAAELFDRQVWWFGTVIATAIGLYLMVLRPEIWAKIGGLVLMLVPHAIGAPQPADITSNVPAVLAAEYAVAALATGLFFWVALGLLLGTFNARFAKMA